MNGNEQCFILPQNEICGLFHIPLGVMFSVIDKNNFELARIITKVTCFFLFLIFCMAKGH